MILLAFCLFLMFLINVVIFGVLSDNVDGDIEALFVWGVVLCVMFYTDAHVVDWLVNTKQILS